MTAMDFRYTEKIHTQMPLLQACFVFPDSQESQAFITTGPQGISYTRPPPFAALF